MPDGEIIWCLHGNREHCSLCAKKEVKTDEAGK